MAASRRRRGLAAAAFVLGLIAALSPAFARDKDKDDAENRLRAALRQATSQVRELEDQNAALQAKQAEAERDHQALTDKLAADEKELKELDVLRQRSKADKDALQKSAAKIEDTENSLAKWQAAYKEAADLARARDADAKRLDAEAKRRDAALVQTRQLKSACETKNQELYKLGEEVLNLYDKKGFLDVVAAAEPVTQLKRVEYQNIMQDYEDKLRANEIVPPAVQ